MAGIARPGDDILVGSGIECIDYEIIEYRFTNNNSSPYGLFDGTALNNFNTSDGCYLNATDYFVIKINNRVNIYRCGTTDFKDYIGSFTVYKLKGNSYVNITSAITQTLSPITNSQWELYIKKLEPGTYKFNGIAPRLDSEWFLELTSASLIKSNSKYYSIKPEYYNTETKTYNPVDIKDFKSCAFLIDGLFSQITINDETFKPVDKFDKFSVITNANQNISIRGLKTNLDLVVASNDIPSSVVKHIDSITLSCKIDNDGEVKAVISTDSGNTWMTWDAAQDSFVLIPLNIPKKQVFDLFTEEEKINWNSSAVSIIEKGIDVKTLNILNFNKLADSDGNFPNKIRFAYAIKRPTLDDNSSVSKLTWQFDANGCFQLMADSEKMVYVHSSQIKVKSLISSDIIKVSVMV